MSYLTQEQINEQQDNLHIKIQDQQATIDKLVEGLEDAISFIDRTGRCGEFYTDHKTNKYKDLINSVTEGK